MAKTGLKTKAEQSKLKTFIAELLKNRKSDIALPNGKASAVKISELIKEELGMDCTRQTVSNYLKEDLSKYLKLTLVSNNEKIKEINKSIEIAKDLMEDKDNKPGDRTKALNSYNSLINTKIKYEQQLRDYELKKAEIEKPNFLFKINPGSVEVICPECGHKFFNVPEKGNVEKFKSELKENKVEEDKDE